jgi:hypothetical protein
MALSGDPAQYATSHVTDEERADIFEAALERSVARGLTRLLEHAHLERLPAKEYRCKSEAQVKAATALARQQAC